MPVLFPVLLLTLNNRANIAPNETMHAVPRMTSSSSIRFNNAIAFTIIMIACDISFIILPALSLLSPAILETATIAVNKTSNPAIIFTPFFKSPIEKPFIIWIASPIVLHASDICKNMDPVLSVFFPPSAETPMKTPNSIPMLNIFCKPCSISLFDNPESCPNASEMTETAPDMLLNISPVYFMLWDVSLSTIFP